MKLIIAEKPSLARNIVAGIGGKMTKKNGYFEGEDTLSHGHSAIFSLFVTWRITMSTLWKIPAGRWIIFLAFPKASNSA